LPRALFGESLGDWEHLTLNDIVLNQGKVYIINGAPPTSTSAGINANLSPKFCFYFYFHFLPFSISKSRFSDLGIANGDLVLMLLIRQAKPQNARPDF
jgi:hypothetical protein